MKKHYLEPFKIAETEGGLIDQLSELNNIRHVISEAHMATLRRIEIINEATKKKKENKNMSSFLLKLLKSFLSGLSAETIESFLIDNASTIATALETLIGTLTNSVEGETDSEKSVRLAVLSEVRALQGSFSAGHERAILSESFTGKISAFIARIEALIPIHFGAED
ncbi:MAG: hypothetical protein WC371_05385 [Parachlamydiales bacterium]